MTIKRLLQTIFAVFLPFLLTGCWDNRPIEKRGLVLAVGIDPIPAQARKMQFTFIESGVVSSRGAPQPIQMITHTATAISLNRAIVKAEEKMTRDLYLGKLQDVVISTHLSPAQIQDLMDALMRDPALDKTYYLAAVAGESAHKVVQFETPNQVEPMTFLAARFHCKHCSTAQIGEHFWEAFVDVNTAGRALQIPMVKIHPNGLKVDTLAIYQGYRFVGSFDRQETVAYLMMRNRVRKAVVEVRTPQGVADVIIKSSTVKKKVDWQNGGPVISIALKLHGLITQKPAKMNTISQIRINEIAELSEKQIMKLVLKTLAKSAHLRTDVLGFGVVFRHTHPFLAAKYHPWTHYYNKAMFHLKVTLQIEHMGDLT